MTMKFKCEACGKEHEIFCAELDWEVDENDPEREMGTASHHTASWEDTCECGNDMSIAFGGWEYPSGVLEDEDDPVTQGIKLLPDEGTCCISFEEEDNEEELI